MKDLLLWRLLREGEFAPADAVELLGDLAQMSLPERLPFFGCLQPVVEHTSPKVRAAGLAVLAGATGQYAFRALVDALGDEQFRVQMAALESLRRSAASGDASRWVHATFHPNPGIRQAALAGDDVRGAEWYPLHLLPDEACAETALVKVAEMGLSASRLPLVMDLCERGRIGRPMTRQLLVGVGIDECQRFLESLICSACEEEKGTVDKSLLGQVVDLFWDIEADSESNDSMKTCRAKEFFDTAWHVLLGLDECLGEEFSKSAAATAQQRGRWSPYAARACAIVHPDFLQSAEVPKETRHRSIEGLYEASERCAKQEDEPIKRLLAGDLCRRPSGNFDLWAVGGILHLLKGNPIEKLIKWFGLGRVRSSCLEDLEQAASLFSVRDDSPKGRRYLIQEIRKWRKPAANFLLALLAYVVSRDQVEVLLQIEAENAFDVLQHLLKLRKRPELTLADRKAERAGRVLAERLDLDGFQRFLRAWLAEIDAEQYTLGREVLCETAKRLDAEQFAEIASSLEPPLLQRLLVAVRWSAGFPYGKEVLLAVALADHSDEEIREWARARVPTGTAPAVPAKRTHPALKDIPDAMALDIGSCSDSELPAIIEPCLSGQWRGLVRALANRPDPKAAYATVCAALLASHDPIQDVDREFLRFGSNQPGFLQKLDEAMVRFWEGKKGLPTAANAWLWRWDPHAHQFGDEIAAHSDGLAGALRQIRIVNHPVLRQQMWKAVRNIVGMWRYSNKDRLAAITTALAIDELIVELPNDVGDVVAGILMRLLASGVVADLLEAAKPRIAAMLPDVSAEARRTLQPWIDSRGLGGAVVVQRATKRKPDKSVLRRIAASDDLDQLEALCRDPDSGIVSEAALRLIQLGSAGTDRLAAVLNESPPAPCATIVAQSVSLWPDGPPVDKVRSLVHDSAAPPQFRFLAGIELILRGEREPIESVLDAACTEDRVSWFRPEDWRQLVELGFSERLLATRLVVSFHPHAYSAAVTYLTSDAGPGADAVPAVREFLECGSNRLRERRIEAASWLCSQGDWSGFPILLAHTTDQPERAEGLLKDAPGELVECTVTAVLTAGNNVFQEKNLLALLEAHGIDPLTLNAILGRVVADVVDNAVRQAAVERIQHTSTRSWKLRRIAETFAWGVQMGRQLTSRLFHIGMIGGEELGYTRLRESKIYVTPLPILRRERHGQQIVRGLILHEIGHHIYHRGQKAEEVWDEAAREHLASLLNLVADEHLERNLRATDQDFGDKLKRLAAYAFQHSAKEIPVDSLLHTLGARAFEVLTTLRMRVARKPGCVRVNNGQILIELEQAGHSFSRFVRSLRMGLGNRHNDPKVAEALKLFRKNFRNSSMNDLLDIARKLREIFGSEADLLGEFSQDGIVTADEAERIIHGEGITDAEIQSEIQRINAPPSKRGRDRGRRAGGARLLNVGPDESFEPITNVVPMPFDRERYMPYAQHVARHARHFRQYLYDLGAKLRPQRRRVQGKTLDRARLSDLVIRGDPRVLITRELHSVTDLFVAAVIDCSGSMHFNQHIEKAKLFGALLAEAARDFPGVDLRLFGFTDAEIYDAGDAGRPAVSALEAGGGNNDAAALWHAAQVAQASAHRAKLLVMISDGLPTECSVKALRRLVSRVSGRMGICCAQVAVQPLEEICFPHYIVLQEDNLDVCVRQFGRIVARLVRRAMAGG